jgi:hypothetical protein
MSSLPTGTLGVSPFAIALREYNGYKDTQLSRLTGCGHVQLAVASCVSAGSGMRSVQLAATGGNMCDHVMHWCVILGVRCHTHHGPKRT